jgi:hypothetical protein
MDRKAVYGNFINQKKHMVKRYIQQTKFFQHVIESHLREF